MIIWAVYSSFFTPLEFGFFRGLPEKLFLLDIVGQLAFLIDIVLRFFVAYKDPHSHRLICDHNLIAIRYLKSRFVLDVLGCLPLDAIYKFKRRFLLRVDVPADCFVILTARRILYVILGLLDNHFQQLGDLVVNVEAVIGGNSPTFGPGKGVKVEKPDGRESILLLVMPKK
nr:potassium channel SKOR-like isoform X2 [Tanacetum cinerariifolium]